MEKRAFRVPGFLMVGILTLGSALAIVAIATAATGGDDAAAGVAAVAVALVAVIVALSASGFMIVNPNEARVVQFFGRYIGSSSTRSARRRWCPTCSSCCAATAASSQW